MKTITTRIIGAYQVLFSRRFIAIVHDQKGCLAAHYNVGADEFAAMAHLTLSAMGQIEGEEFVMEQVKEILN